MISNWDKIIDSVRRVLAGEARVIQKLQQTIDEPMRQALEILLPHQGQIVVTGVGKSNYIARKIAATLTSTGTRAVFLHPAEALHGDIGILHDGDPVIVLSKSGTSEEIVRLMPLFRRFQSKVIAITARKDSELARNADVVILIDVDKEDDPIGMIPTTSAVASLAAGDAIACALMEAKGFTKQDFSKLHVGGQIGRNLLLSVRDVMTRLDDVACLSLTDTLRDVVVAMTEKPLGGALILEKSGKINGLITEGDIRRALKLNKSIDKIYAEDIMTRVPRTVNDIAYLGEALQIMETGKSPVSVLPVIDSQERAIGLLRLHDAYRA